MKIVLLGNGLEIEFQENLGKEQIIKNALEWPITNPQSKRMIKSVFPTAIKHFAKVTNLSISNITERDWKMAYSYLTSEKTNKSIEDFFEDIERSISNRKGQEELKNLFVKYIDYFSNKIDLKQFEKIEEVIKIENGDYVTLNQTTNLLEEKFSSYDLILTTNYTDFLKRNLKKYGNKIVYLHGKINDKVNPPLIGLEKTSNKEITFKKVMDNLKQALESLDEENIDKNKIVLDIYGWSFDNEEDLIKLIIHSIMNFMIKDSYVFSGTQQDWAKKTWELNIFSSTMKQVLESEIQNKALEINYYYHTEDDLQKAENYIKTSEWIQKKSIELIETHDWRDELHLFKVNQSEETSDTITFSKFNNGFKVTPLKDAIFEITKEALAKKRKN